MTLIPKTEYALLLCSRYRELEQRVDNQLTALTNLTY